MAAGIIIGVTEYDGHNKFVTVEDAYRESKANLAELLNAPASM
ncbi:MAG: hypothetical protein ACTS73_08930 [Arsenophonus sp. NEOnobi-MAG3]